MVENIDDMTTDEITEYRKSEVMNYYPLWDIVDLFDSAQFEKVKKIVSEIVTDDQIDDLFLDM